MNDRAYLHDGEILLASQHASVSGLIHGVLRGLIEGLFFGAIVGIAAVLGLTALGGDFGVWLGGALAVLAVVIVIAQRVRLWKHTTLRITSERILVPEVGSLLHPPLHTIKWPQYQESHTGHRHGLDALFLSKTLCIRYGTADAHKEVCFPSLRFAGDLKHFLDKVDSAVRRGDVDSVKPFVAKRKGKRDIGEGREA